MLALAPFLLGGYGNFGLPAYAGSYNLPELSFGLGVLPLVAAFSLAGRRALRRASSATGVWYVLLAVGLVLALGGETPAGHAFTLIPLFGGQRLQSRNAALIDARPRPRCWRCSSTASSCVGRTGREARSRSSSLSC